MTFRFFQHIIISAIFSLSAVAQDSNKKTNNSESTNIKPLRIYKSPKLSDYFQKIVSNKNYAYIPRGCILYTPERHKSKITLASGHTKLLNWKEFSRKNQSWVHTVPLTKGQVFKTQNGKRYEFPYEKLEALKKLGRVIICTYKNKPIRVKIQKQPDQKK